MLFAQLHQLDFLDRLSKEASTQSLELFDRIGREKLQTGLSFLPRLGNSQLLSNHGRSRFRRVDNRHMLRHDSLQQRLDEGVMCAAEYKDIRPLESITEG